MSASRVRPFRAALPNWINCLDVIVRNWDLTLDFISRHLFLLTGEHGIGKTELILQMRGLWRLPVLYFGGGMLVSNDAVSSVMRRSVVLVEQSRNHVLILDDVGVDAEESARMHLSEGGKKGQSRILIVAQTASKRGASHSFDTHLHMKKRGKYQTVIKCEKNRFGPAGGQIYRLLGSRVWRHL